MRNQQTEDEQRQQNIERFMKKRGSKVYEVELIDGKPQMVCSVCGGTSFSFCSGFTIFFVVVTTFYRICNKCGNKIRHGGKVS